MRRAGPARTWESWEGSSHPGRHKQHWNPVPPVRKGQPSKPICSKALTEYMERYLLLSTSLSERTDYWNAPDPPQASLLLSTEIWFPVLTVYPPRPNPVRDEKKESSSNGLMLKKKCLVLFPYVELSPRCLKPQHREAEQLTLFIKRAPLSSHFPSLLESGFYHHQPSSKAHCELSLPSPRALYWIPLTSSLTSLVLLTSSSLSLHHDFIPFLLTWCFNSLGPETTPLTVSLALSWDSIHHSLTC